MKINSLLVLGANSDIAFATSHRFAKEGCNLILAGRDLEQLRKNGNDLRIRYNVDVYLCKFDVLATKNHQTFVTQLPTLPDAVLCTVGTLGKQNEAERSPSSASKIIKTNFEGPASILGIIANEFECRGYGTIIAVTSVAALRGRASNYVYGSAKAGLTSFLSGLRNRLASSNVHVITVLPGYVNTKMTAKLKLPAVLTAETDEVASAIFNASRKQKDVVYVRRIWFFIMLIIRMMPEKIFKRVRL